MPTRDRNLQAEPWGTPAVGTRPAGTADCQTHDADYQSHNASYQNPDLPIPQRVADLISRMTIPEKVGQMLQLAVDTGTWGGAADLDHLIGHYQIGSILHTAPDLLAKAIDIAAQTRLAIPLLLADDCIHGYSFWPGATILPNQLAMACTWNPDLIEAGARLTAVEVSCTGLVWTFSPVLCIARDLRWGRVGETFGEDPFLIGEFGAAMVRGYQGAGLSDPTAILACAKHFAGYSETIGGRDASEADISRRKLRSWFLPPFERVARAGCRTFMLGYQSMDGVPITINDWLLGDVLKGEWGFTGLLVTDWDNVGQLVRSQGISADFADAATRAVKAGNDLVMTTPEFFEGAQQAIADGRLTEADLDAAVARILTVKFELGLFENPRRPDVERQREVIGCAEHRETALQLARESLVLLRNDGCLPLAANVARVAVVGPNADDPLAQLGDWAGMSGQTSWMPDGHPRKLTETVLDGLRAVAPGDLQLSYARGADIAEPSPHPDGPAFPDGQPRPPIVRPAQIDQALIDEATATVAAADVAVVVIGDNVCLTGEGRSTATLELIGGQVTLIESVAATGTPFVLVLINSKPLVLPAAAEQASAIIEAFNPGMRGGRAIAELLFGQIEPVGRLPISVARHVGQQPVFYNVIRGQHGDRYADLTQEPMFLFGEGLSYSRVEYSDLSIAAPEVSVADAVTAEVSLTNRGDRVATETVQVYVHDVVASVTWAGKELKAFRRVEVPASETVRVRLELAAADCTIVDADGRRLVEPGEFRLLVGPSSRDDDLLSASFTVRA